MILKMWVKSEFVLWKPRYYNLLTEKKDKKIHVFEIIILWKRTIILSVSRNSLQISSLDDILLGNFALSNSIILVEHLTRWKKGFEIFLIDHYAGDNRNKNIASKY